MSLRKRAKENAALTSKQTMKIGFIGQVVIKAGVVGRFVKQEYKPGCFVPYEGSGLSEEGVRLKAIELAENATGRTGEEIFPCLWIDVVPDTSITPTSRYRGSFVSMESPNSNPRTHKRHSDFLLDYMSDELEDAEGKKVWVHISWVRLPEEYGGDFSLVGDDANNELSMLVTYIENKRSAVELAKSLREGSVTLDGIILDRGYDIKGVREKMKKNYGENESKESKPLITALGEKTLTAYNTVEYFCEDETIKFLQTSLGAAKGDVEKAAVQVNAEPGDLGIVLEQIDYFRSLMKETGLEEQKALVKVASDTGVVHASDLANLLGIEEPPF